MEENKKKVMLVDDETAIGELISVLFGMEKGYELLYVQSGEECLKRLNEGYCPELILMDVMMPGMNGFQACSEIRGEKKYAGIKIYYYSAMPEYELKPKIEETKADGYITKDTDIMEIMKKVMNITG